MELKPIEDIRIGQIWQSKANDFIYSSVIKKIKDTYFECDIFGNETFCKEDSRLNKEKLIDFLECKLTGFLNITHKLEDNRLVEIKREEFEVGDIIKITNFIKDSFNNTCGQFNEIKVYDEKDDLSKHDKFEKIGIYGITHEFKNKKLINKE